jgi:hypothetical protein
VISDLPRLLRGECHCNNIEKAFKHTPVNKTLNEGFAPRNVIYLL